MTEKYYTDSDGVVWEPGEADGWDTFFEYWEHQSRWETKDLSDSPHLDPFFEWLEKNNIIRRVESKYKDMGWYRNEAGMVAVYQKVTKFFVTPFYVARENDYTWTPVRIVPERFIQRPCFRVDRRQCPHRAGRFCRADVDEWWTNCFAYTDNEEEMMDWLHGLLESC